MPELQVGQAYLCKNGDVRRIDSMTDDFIRYSIPMYEVNRFMWVNMMQMKREIVEPYFEGAEILDPEVNKRIYDRESSIDNTLRVWKRWLNLIGSAKNG